MKTQVGTASRLFLAVLPLLWVFAACAGGASVEPLTWKTPALDDLVIYELMITEFGGDIDRTLGLLDYLADLGRTLRPDAADRRGALRAGPPAAAAPPTPRPDRSGGALQELQESIEQPARWRAHSGRFPAKRSRPGCWS